MKAAIERLDIPGRFIVNECPSCKREFVLLVIIGKQKEKDIVNDWHQADFMQHINDAHWGKRCFCPLCGSPFFVADGENNQET